MNRDTCWLLQDEKQLSGSDKGIWLISSFSASGCPHANRNKARGMESSLSMGQGLLKYGGLIKAGLPPTVPYPTHPGRLYSRCAVNCRYNTFEYCCMPKPKQYMYLQKRSNALVKKKYNWQTWLKLGMVENDNYSDPSGRHSERNRAKLFSFRITNIYILSCYLTPSLPPPSAPPLTFLVDGVGGRTLQ